MDPPVFRIHDSYDRDPPVFRIHDSNDKDPPVFRIHNSYDMDPPVFRIHNSYDMDPPEFRIHDSYDMDPPVFRIYNSYRINFNELDLNIYGRIRICSKTKSGSGSRHLTPVACIIVYITRLGREFVSRKPSIVMYIDP